MYLDDPKVIEEIDKLDDDELDDKLNSIARSYLSDHLSEVPLCSSTYVDSSIEDYDVMSIEECNEPTEIVWLTEDIKLEVEARIKYPIAVNSDIENDDIVDLYKKEYHTRIKNHIDSVFTDIAIKNCVINKLKISSQDVTDKDITE